jgi:hypothetical protein
MNYKRFTNKFWLAFTDSFHFQKALQNFTYMKNKLHFLLLVFVVVACQSLSAQTKHALIVAIGNYPKAGGWQQISSVRDAACIKQALLKQGFPESNIKTVTDAAATVKGIAGAITELISEVHPGDVALIHFSSTW